MLYIDLKYLKLLPLEQFTDKGSGKYNFRCPICGDSKKRATLKRGWATNYKNTLFIHCYNCDYSSSFSKFLKLYFPQYYPDYIKEKFQSKDIFKKETKRDSVDIFATEYDHLDLQKIGELPSNHKAVAYLKQRKIDAKQYNEFYYSDEFSYWVNQHINDSLFSDQKFYDPRIVIPFYNRYKKIFALQGRTINGQNPKYLTVKMDQSEDKLFGLDKVHFTSPIFLFEGPLDSLFIHNSLACAGSLSNVDTVLKYTNKDNITIVPDNDFRNKQTKKFIEESLKHGYKTVIWPNGTNFKDINEAIIKGYTEEQICSMIKNNTYSGLMGFSKLKLK